MTSQVRRFNVHVLGSGTITPSANRRPASLLVESDESRVLIDCGFTTFERLLANGIELQSLDAVAVSHFHTDHFADVLPIIHSRFVSDRLQQRSHAPMKLIGPNGLEVAIARLREVFWPETHQEFPLEFVEGAASCEIGSLTIQVFPVCHVPYFHSVGFRVQLGKRAFAYTGDLAPRQDDSVVAALHSVDLLITEAAGSENSRSHMTLDNALELADRCHAKRLLLLHLRDDQALLVKKRVSGLANVSVAIDNEVIEI